MSSRSTGRSHYLWLLFWPLYWLRYVLIEQLNPAAAYTPIHCPFDDLIPFCEWFLVPYILWMPFMVLLALYCLRTDRDSFIRYSKFLAIAMTISGVIFLLFPTCQELRPAVYPRDNLMTDLVRLLHRIDTNTNVLPSEHAVGAIAVVIAASSHPKLRRPRSLIPICMAMGLVCLSTVFLKQHSVLDLLAAVPVCAVAWWLSYRPKITRKREKS